MVPRNYQRFINLHLTLTKLDLVNNLLYSFGNKQDSLLAQCLCYETASEYPSSISGGISYSASNEVKLKIKLQLKFIMHNVR